MRVDQERISHPEVGMGHTHTIQGYIAERFVTRISFYKLIPTIKNVTNVVMISCC